MEWKIIFKNVDGFEIKRVIYRNCKRDEKSWRDMNTVSRASRQTIEVGRKGNYVADTADTEDHK